MELADVVDSKSTASDGVPVRVRPPAPNRVSITHFVVMDTRFLCNHGCFRILLKGGGAVKRSDFYKKYYRVTDMSFCDRTIWFAKDRERAHRKGQIRTSKTERKVFIVVQYLVLVLAGICFWCGQYRYGAGGCVLFLLIHLVTDFSILKIELLYRIYSRKNPYAALLYQAFTREAGDFWHEVQTRVKKHISGFVRVNRGKFSVKYRVVYRNKQDDVYIVLKPLGMTLKTKAGCFKLKQAVSSLAEVADRIVDVLQ